MTKTAIVIYSDPKSGGQEALGRLFNALFVAYELKEKRQQVAVMFQGAGVRWASELVRPTHPAHALYNAIKDEVVGVCGGCADVFGATRAATTASAQLIREQEIPGTSGIIDISKYLEDGFRVLNY